MARIAGVDLPKHKRIEIGISYIYGIGKFIAKEILQKTGISPDVRVKDLTEKEIAALQQTLDNYLVEGDLRRKVHSDIGRLKAINCYRGIRHKLRLPVRGQRTQANARTWKGPRPAKAGKKK
ncbi:30S ribosomal protein S13 [Candidatus Bipolaricaulota bacterium]|nr:30S ribosomal protein S13 [Candidatus Bipolaricaulota bacterium]HBR10542.1 30S ribosomal protein S13 [Candidatus Acetothermia bacterium]